MGVGDGCATEGDGVDAVRPMEDPQLRAQLDELKIQVQQRMEMRCANEASAVAQLRADLVSGKVKLKSDIKKSSAFVKKLKLLTENSVDALVKDAQELNLTRYVSECVAALVEAPFKVVDLPAAVRVASLLHQRYAEFGALLVQTLVASFDASYGTDDKNKMVKRRIILRMLTDLYLVGVFSDVQIIANIVQRVARREGSPLTSGKSRSSGGGKGNMSLGGGGAAEKPPGQLEVPLLVSFAKSVGVEFLGVLPKKYKEMMAAYGDAFQEVIASQQTLVPEPVQKHCLVCLEEAYDLTCKIYLAQHATLVKLQKRNEREDINRGEVAESHVQELDNAKQLFDKLQTSVNALADALDKEVPLLPEQRQDDELLGGITLWEGGEGGARELRPDSPFDDEDTRSFYEDLPDLIELVPAVVLGLSEADVAELKKKKEAARNEQAGPEDEEVDVEDDADGDELSSDVAAESEPDDKAMAASEQDKDKDSTDDATASGAVGAVVTGYQHQHDAFFASLEDMVNRDRCDKAAVDFCYRNSKANRNRLVRTLFAVPRTHLELLSYYARLVATLQSVLKDDIGTELVDLLVSEFNYHVKKRNQFRLESKIKNIRFISELVKFQVCHPSVAFRCLKRCFVDFQGHNVYIATALFENCGRFLYCLKQTHARTAHFLTVMMKLKSAKHLDPQAETLVENAYYMCRPPERVERAHKQYDPKYLFILKLLYEDLGDQNASKIVKTLRKFPWANDGKMAGMVVKAVLKVTKGRVMHMKWVCEVVKGLARYHDQVGILLVDDVLEAIRHGLELNDYRDHQVSLGYVKLLSELFNAGLVSASVVLDTLYLIINQSHDLLTLPQYGGGNNVASAAGASASTASAAAATTAAVMSAAQLDEFKRRCKLVPELRFDPRVPSAVDSPTDVFRVRLVCALVEGCNGTTSSSAPTTATTTPASDRAPPASASGSDYRSTGGLSKTRLGRFLAFFQRYISAKTEIPMETDFVVLDLFDALAVSLKEHFHRCETWEEADDAVATILREELDTAERKAARAKALASAAATTASVLADVLEEDDESEDDDEEEEYDDDDEEDEEDAATAVENKGVDGEEEEEDEDDEDEDDEEDDEDEEDEDDDDDEDEDEEEQLVIHDRVQATEEDEDFEKAFKAMMQASAEPRKIVGRVNVDKMVIPTMIKAATTAPVAVSAAAASAGDGSGSGDAGDGARASSSSSFGSAGGPFGGSGGFGGFGGNGGGVVFRMLRRGNKGKVEARHLVVPEGTSLAQHSQRQENAGKKEQSELKRLVLQNIEREDFFASDLDGMLSLDEPLIAPATSTVAWPPLMPRPAQGAAAGSTATAASTAPVAGPRSQYQGRSSASTGGQSRPTSQPRATSQSQRQPQQKAQQKEPPRAGYGANADWNNDEFGLRRGRNYRGTK